MSNVTIKISTIKYFFKQDYVEKYHVVSIIASVNPTIDMRVGSSTS